MRRRFRLFKKRLLSRPFVLLAIIITVALSTIIYSEYMHDTKQNADPKTYNELLTVIGEAESKGNYNAYFGNATNTTIRFTDMSIAQVMQWQAEHLAKGNVSSAVGKYQIINTTLSGLVQRLDIDKNQKFDENIQDQLAIALIEKRGANRYVNEELNREQLAHNLSMEWAGLPKVIGENPEQSYYAGDGINASRAKVHDVLKAIGFIQPARK